MLQLRMHARARSRTHTLDHTTPPPRLLQCASSSYHRSTGRQKNEREEKEDSRIDEEEEKRKQSRPTLACRRPSRTSASFFIDSLDAFFLMRTRQ